MDETLSQYNSGTKKSVKVLKAIEEDDFSSLDYESIKHTEFFKSLGLTTLQDYIKGKNLSDSESKNLYQKFYYFLAGVISLALELGHNEDELYRKAKHVINFNRIRGVKLYSIEYLKKVELELEKLEKGSEEIQE